MSSRIEWAGNVWVCSRPLEPPPLTGTQQVLRPGTGWGWMPGFPPQSPHTSSDRHSCWETTAGEGATGSAHPGLEAGMPSAKRWSERFLKKEFSFSSRKGASPKEKPPHAETSPEEGRTPNRRRDWEGAQRRRGLGPADGSGRSSGTCRHILDPPAVSDVFS